jgi:SAM-dependent methyltransferase
MEFDYVTDVPYTAAFYPDLSPVALNLIAATNGFAPRSLDHAFTYCELGCGFGFSTNMLAACFPQATFLGVDLMSVHIESAKKLAAAGGLGNVTFLESDFAALSALELPEFDFITLHGVYTWVGEAVQRNICDFIRRRLKPGGLVYISYNALPGWSALLPLRDMMLAYSRHVPGDSIAKAKHGLGYLEYLRSRGSEYFAKTPSAAEALDRLKRHSINYVVHEYFHPNWSPMYFSEVADDMEEAGCIFVGNALLRDNFPPLALPKQFHELITTAPSRLVFETHKDFVRNTQFRRDIFIKPNAKAAAPAERGRLIEHMCFGMPVEPSEFKAIATTGLFKLHLTGPIFAPLMAALADGAKSAAQLRSLPTLGAFSAKELMDAIAQLLISQQALPFARPTRAVADGIQVPDARPPVTILHPFNRIVLQEKMFDGPQVVVASGALGTGVELSMGEALAVLALSQVRRAEAAAWACDFLERHSRPLVVDGKKVEGREATVAKLGEAVEAFLTRHLPKFIELGIVEPTAG